MAGYRLRTLAREDLEAIWDYTLEQWAAVQAERYLASLIACFNDLFNSPNLGRLRDDVLPGLRSFPQGRHLVFYEIDGADIEIIGIVHQSADVSRHMGPD